MARVVQKNVGYYIIYNNKEMEINKWFNTNYHYIVP
ncbi:hypothetical protein [Blattabacterium punctulatus]|nr:hypothetical protein [Blattabacterium punctulatus]